jgi:hypothetical protein
MGGVWFFGLGAKHFARKKPTALESFFSPPIYLAPKRNLLLWRGVLHSKVVLQTLCRAPGPTTYFNYFNH